MSAFRGKADMAGAPHMSAFGSKGDIYLRRLHWTTLSWHNDDWNWQAESHESSVLARPSWPRRAFMIGAAVPTLAIALVRLGDSHETARVHHPTWRCGGRMAAGGKCTAAE